MSGIFGLLNLNGRHVTREELYPMASLLERRGPDGTHIKHENFFGFGHTLLATTPELLFETQPLSHTSSGCVITADVRLDNRDELIGALGVSEKSRILGDAGLILEAYLAWGESCVNRFLGDYAFCIWDPRHRSLFCVRDHFGMRPFYYHNTPGRFFAFASEPRAILVLPQTPYCINEGRIADCLVFQLEGIDKTSTFFEEVHRLPPAHALTVTQKELKIWQYWTPKPVPELRLSSDEAYTEAFDEIFTQAVRCRLKSHGPIGSMLSGGIDSGSVVAAGREILAQDGRSPLLTFSAVGPDPMLCVETRTVHEALTMPGLEPHLISYEELDEWLPELDDLTWNLDEPFDWVMTLLRVVYLAAHHRGIKTLLDGVGGDIVVFSTGNDLARLLRGGRWLSAWRQASGLEAFYSGAYPAWKWIYSAARKAFIPNRVIQLRRKLDPRYSQRRMERAFRESLINREFADRIDLEGRLKALYRLQPKRAVSSCGDEQAWVIDHPYITVGRERYDRTAAAIAVEPRDPYLDRRLVEFCLALPCPQKLSDGWSKMILRRASSGRLPETVRWRKGRTHLGGHFTTALIKKTNGRISSAINDNINLIEPYMDIKELRIACRSYLDQGDLAKQDLVPKAAHLASWLKRHAVRPQEPKNLDNLPENY